MAMIVGTSGWQYADWRTVFYPPGVPQRRWLEHYARSFATVELNAAFYRPVARGTFEGWRARTPDNALRFAEIARTAGWPVTRTPAPLPPVADPPPVSREWNAPW
ncbi:DUF72 domain-containing protein [Nocardia huaxiensis]|uniref:DUF72 domain-containing protein n=1 Tax=Nocardia huaxiensis TaxID=2755382 RepID=UPI001E4017DF|nr:DUF72 domain-containing protein [Nocardia huaxiensis]UFS97296.1 DUF72 domain-containing protein [Nocardia huaxiensis]